MRHLKKYKIFESKNSLMNKYGSEIINKIDSDIEYIKDVLIELEDMGFYIGVGYTPLTLTSAQYNKDYKIDPEIFIDIRYPNNWLQFYDETYPLVNKSKDLIDSIISHVLTYMKERGYKPDNEFKFRNNPTTYQINYTYDRSISK